MVLPDETQGPEHIRPKGDRRLLLLAGIAMVVGSVVFATLTSPREPAGSTEPVGETRPASTAEPLRWRLSALFVDVQPNKLVSHDGDLYLFGPVTLSRTDTPSGLAGWQSENGRAWEYLGPVIADDTVIDEIHPTPMGLIAIESRQGSRLHVLMSDDGKAWDRYELPLEITSNYVDLHPTAAGGDEAKSLIAANLSLDGRGLLEDRLGVDLTSLEWSTYYTRDDLIIDVYGPLGLPAKHATASELGLTRDERVWLNSGHVQSGRSRVWTLRDGTEWTQVTMDGAVVESVVSHPDGGLVAFGLDGVVPASWRSPDGVTWERFTTGASVENVVRTGHGLTAVRTSAQPEVVVSADGNRWESTGLTSHLDPAVPWEITTLAAGNGGVVAVVETTQTWGGRPGTPTVVHEDGSILRLYLQGGRFELDTGDTVHMWDMYGEDERDDIDVDLARRMVTFRDITTGEPLAEFDFDEVIEASQWFGQPTGDASILAYSSDGDAWSTQDVAAAFGDKASITQVQVPRDRVVALVRRGDTDAEVWTAERVTEPRQRP